MIRRLLREGLVLRSLVWPASLTIGTLLLTLAFAGTVTRSTEVAVSSDVPADVVDAIVDLGWSPISSNNPWRSVHDGDAWAGTDGSTLWYVVPGPAVLEIEALLRPRSAWIPVPEDRLPGLDEALPQGSLFSRLLAILYTLYGVIFGLGMVARDRDDGTLDAELSLPLPHWLPGAARWIAATVVLSLFFSLCVVLFHALVGVEHPWALVRHGAAAAGSATAIGLLAVGTAGTRQGFSGPLAAGLTAATAAIALGFAAPSVGMFLPLASVFAGGSGWIPVLLTLALGAAATAGFAWRSATT